MSLVENMKFGEHIWQQYMFFKTKQSEWKFQGNEKVFLTLQTV